VSLKVITLSQLWIEILLAPERHRLTVTEVCRRYGISRKTYYAYRARYRAAGVEGLEPRSRRPKSSPRRTPAEVEATVVEIRLARPRWGARKIRAELVRRGLGCVPAVSTVHAILRREGLIGEQPRRRQLAMKRFERPVPNDLWQIDATQVALADKSKAWIVDVLDDHARFAIAAKACKTATTAVAWDCMDEAIRTHGAPRQVISDNGLSFTGRRHQREVLFEKNLKALGIQPLTSKPRHPQTCGKLERFHQTMKDWLSDQPPAQTVEDLQALIDEFRWHYNVERPHQSLRQATPAHAYEATDKAGPLPAGDGTVRPRTLRVNSHGAISYRKRKIQVGSELRGQTVHAVEDNGIVRIYRGHEPLRELLLGPKGTYHGNGKKPTGRPPATKIA
jgi:transposase InsO family protein